MRLAELLATFDDGALAALASKGLLRRAKKDLAAGAVTGVAEEGDALAIHLGAVTVTMPAAGPAFSECSCPASGCCRHILAATLHLMHEGVPGAGDGHNFGFCQRMIVDFDFFDET